MGMHQRGHRLGAGVQAAPVVAVVVAVGCRKIVAEARQGGDGGVVRPGGVEALLRVPGIEVVALRVQRPGEVRRDVHDAEVRGIGLVGAETVGVGLERRDVRPGMGGNGDTVQDDPYSQGARLADHVRHGVDGADDVGAVGHAQDPDLSVQQGMQLLKLQFPVPVHRPGAKLGAAAPAEPLPGADIGLVVLARDDHGAARRHQAGGGQGQGVDVLGGGRTDGDGAGVDPEQIRHHLAPQVHLFSGRPADFAGAVGLHLVFGVEPDVAFKHLAHHVAAAGILEKGGSGGQGLLEGREAAADEFDVEDGHGWRDIGIPGGVCGNRPVVSIRAARAGSGPRQHPSRAEFQGSPGTRRYRGAPVCPAVTRLRPG